MRVITRVFSFFARWLADVLRQPALMLVLVVGPFLVLLAFGRGIDIGGPQPRAIVVWTGDASEPLQPLPEELTDHITVVDETEDMAYAQRELNEGSVDAVVVLPENATEYVNRGEHVPIRVLLNVLDPVRRSYASAFLRDQVATLNQRAVQSTITDAQSSGDQIAGLADEARAYIGVIRDLSGPGDVREELRNLEEVLGPLSRSVQQVARTARTAAVFVPALEDSATEAEELERRLAELRATVADLSAEVDGASGSATLPDDADLDAIEEDLAELEAVTQRLQNLPPEVLSAPFVLDVEQRTGVDLTFAGFYAPAVLVLLLQHLAVTLGALSMARMRLLQITDLLRVAPVRPSEVVVGQYIAYGALAAIVGAALLGLMVLVLDVPVLGSLAVLGGALLLLVVASLGIGFVISLLSRTEQHATQLAMLILLASVFFSGFAFSLDRITWPVRAVSYLLPATYGIRTLQDVMLRGLLREPLDLVILGAAGALLLAVTVALFRRESRLA